MADPRSTLGAFYDAKWEEWNDMIRHSPAPRIRREKILAWMKAQRPATVLDVGCGNAEFLVEAVRRMPGAAFCGADISGAAVEKNRERFPGAEFFELDLDGQTLPRRFDAVACMEVVEHCQDYRTAIARLADMTGGRLYLTVPCGPVFEIDRRVGHTRHFSAEEIRSALTDAGLTVETLQCWGFPFFNLYKHAINWNPDAMSEAFLSTKTYGPKQKLLAWGTYLAFRLCLPWGGYQLFAVARR